jgi:hypothetical protein
MKKIIGIFCCVCLLLNFFGGTYAMELSAEIISADIKTERAPITDDLERIILSVKSRINIPEELSKFDYSFYDKSYYSDTYWQLNWRNEDSTSRISVRIDQNENISYYNYSKNREENYVPKYLKEELKPTAENFIKQVAPDVFNKVVYKESSFNGIYSGFYNYTYQRVENGIPMPENTVSISVNYETGEVTSLNIDWLYNIAIPDEEVTVSVEQAKEKIGKEIEMQLVYKNEYIDGDDTQKIRAFLVYTPDDGYIAVDAKTGEVYLTRDEWIIKEELSKAKNDFAQYKEAGGALVSLTKEELAKLEELNKFISKEEAINKVTSEKSLLIDENLKSVTATLDQRYSYRNDDDKTYIWNIQFSDPREIAPDSIDRYRGYANATVDAKTGKIISFSASVKDYYNTEKDKWDNIKVNYSLENGQKILENFVKKQIPEKFKNTIASTKTNDYIIKYIAEVPVYGGYNYTYNRVNEGVEYTYNSINGAVDGVTGKIYRFSYNWDDNISFESPKKAMTPKQAFEHYISKDGFNLVYEINNKHMYSDSSKSSKMIYTDDYSLEKEVRLVYRPDISPNTISPFTGEQLDENGKKYIKVDAYSYDDIDSHWAKKEILLLSDMNIGFEGNSFMPDKSITKEELEKLLSKIGYSSEKIKDEEKDDLLTRSEIVKRLISFARLDKIAGLKGIYTTNFDDENKIAEEDIGYIALAKGFKIVSGDKDNNFNPDRNATRAEAVYMIVRLISAVNMY